MKGGLFTEIITWAILFVIFVIAEIASVQLISIWFAFGALVTMLCTYFFDIPVMGQLAIFIITSAILIAATFPVIRKRLNTARVATNNDLDIGRNATVIEEVNADNGTGRVTLNGVDWCAVPEDRNMIIPVGSIVIVREVQGAKLVVSLKEEKKLQETK